MIPWPPEYKIYYQQPVYSYVYVQEQYSKSFPLLS